MEFGFWLVWCGLFGWKEIGALLRILRNHWFSYKLYAKRLCLIGLGVGAPRIVLLSLSFFLLLVLHLKFFSLLFVAFSCVHHHEHLGFAFFIFSSWLILFSLPIKKKNSWNDYSVIACAIGLYIHTYIHIYIYIYIKATN